MQKVVFTESRAEFKVVRGSVSIDWKGEGETQKVNVVVVYWFVCLLFCVYKIQTTQLMPVALHKLVNAQT